MNAKRNPLGCGGKRSGEGAQDEQLSSDGKYNAIAAPRAARRAMDRYDRKGCWHCGQRTVFVAVGMKGKQWVAMCEEHRTLLDKVHVGAVAIFSGGGHDLPHDGVIETAATPWGTEDRAWFAAHPDRSHRVREIMPGEFPTEAPDDYVGHVVVWQYSPGFRQRLGFAWDHLLDEPPEAWCHALFDVIADCHTRNDFEKILSGEEIKALARGYTSIGRVQ